MDSISIVAMASIFGAALAMAIGSLGPGLGMGQAISQALAAISSRTCTAVRCVSRSATRVICAVTMPSRALSS